MRQEITRREINRGLLTAAINLAAGGASLPEMAVRTPIPLFDFAIAGGWHHGLEQALAFLSPGERLALVAEPDNPHDGDAVAVHRADGLKLGYIPREANTPVAALLRAGRMVEAEIVGFLDIHRARDVPDDVAITSFMTGDPRVRVLVAS